MARARGDHRVHRRFRAGLAHGAANRPVILLIVLQLVLTPIFAAESSRTCSISSVPSSAWPWHILSRVGLPMPSAAADRRRGRFNPVVPEIDLGVASGDRGLAGRLDHPRSVAK